MRSWVASLAEILEGCVQTLEIARASSAAFEDGLAVRDTNVEVANVTSETNSSVLESQVSGLHELGAIVDMMMGTVSHFEARSSEVGCE